MIKRLTAQLVQELHPRRLFPSLTAGLVAGIVTILVEISFAAMIFAGDLVSFVPNGIGLLLFGALVIGIVVALTSSFSGTVAVPQDNSAAILALMAAGIAAAMPVGAAPEQAYYTVVAVIVLASLLTGVFFLLLGWFKLGGLIRYIPYPVIGGFLAGSGWLLVRGSVGVMTDLPLGLEQLPHLFQPTMLLRWLPGLLLAVLLLAMLRRYNHFLIVPGVLLGAVALFFLLLRLSGLSVAEASAQGWLLGPFPKGGLWQPLGVSSLEQVDWAVVIGQVGNVGTILIVSVVSLLLNAGGLELTARRDIDLNQELRAAGLANVLAGLGGGPPGYHALSLSVLGPRMGVSSRLVGIAAAALNGLMLLLGASLLSYFPKPVLGGLLFFLGLAFLVEWLYDAWFKLSRFDYLIVVLILVVMNLAGVLEGVGLGLLLAVVLFVAQYSRVPIVRHSISGAHYHSNVEWPRMFQQLLRRRGQYLYILELQGYLFFGTAHQLLDQVRRRIADASLPQPHFVVLDFRRVWGLDASAVLSLSKMKQLAQARDLVMVFTHLSPWMRRQLEKEVLTEADRASWRTFPSLDHGLEWCEARMIEQFERAGLATRRRSLKQQLESFVPRSSRLVSLVEYLAQGEEEPAPPSTQEISVAALQGYLEKQDVPAGHYLIQQGEVPRGLYFVESGQVTVQLEEAGGQPIRIRKAGAGTIVGEMGLYLGTETSAAVVMEQAGTVYSLSADSLCRMEQQDPAVAAAFHKFIAQLLSERLRGATETLGALQK